MSDLEAIIDEARLLKPGDVVAVSPRVSLSAEGFERFRDQLMALNVRVPGVKFVAFSDCDLTVLRPVERASEHKVIDLDGLREQTEGRP